MAEDIDAETKLKLYMLMVNRYKGLISEKETKSVSEIRQRVSPHGEAVKRLRDRILAGMDRFAYEQHFFTAAQRAISYVRDIKTCRFLLTFWMEFEEIDSLKVAGVMDKALLLAALLRSFGSEDALVKVTKAGRSYVCFSWKGESYLFVPESGSLLAGGDIAKVFDNDPVAYSFNDLVYENYEDQ